MHRLLLHNDNVVDSTAPTVSPGQVGFMNGWGVFSTILVSDGALFAFPRHWARMQADARKLHIPFPEDSEWVRGRLLKLVEANRAVNSTLRVAVVRNRGGIFEAPGQLRAFDLIAFTADTVEWPGGVRLGIKPQARHAQSEFAGTKVLSWAFNLTWNEEAHERGYDEYVLLNERGEVCECTSANIFVIQGSDVWTPPLDSGCLAGITRALLIEEIQIPELRIGEKTLMPADLARADQVFITSTTRDLLAVNHIEGLDLKNAASPHLPRLQQAFTQYRRVSLAHECTVVAT